MFNMVNNVVGTMNVSVLLTVSVTLVTAVTVKMLWLQMNENERQTDIHDVCRVRECEGR